MFGVSTGYKCLGGETTKDTNEGGIKDHSKVDSKQKGHAYILLSIDCGSDNKNSLSGYNMSGGGSISNSFSEGKSKG